MKNSGINTTKNMGARVRQVLDELGWKQIDLLNRVVELDTGTLSALINRNGKTCLWSDEIAEALGVNHRWLQRGEGPKKRPAGEWPFQKLSLEDVLALPESERARIEGYAQRAIEDFRRTPPPQVTACTWSADSKTSCDNRVRGQDPIGQGGGGATVVSRSTSVDI